MLISAIAFGVLDVQVKERKTTRDFCICFPREVARLPRDNLHGNSILKGFKMFSDQPPQRPTMRRKSSAQNLLSSFKSSSSGSTTPQSLNPAFSSVTSLSFSSTTSSTATTPQTREWDAQSLHSDTVGSSMGGAQSPSLPAPGTSVEYLRDLVQKRIITLTYIRQIHEG